MPTVGSTIWISVRPLLKLILTTSCGFAMTKLDRFPPIAARGAGQIALHVTIPALLFSKIVPSFTPQNVTAIGPLMLIAVIYHVIGFVIPLAIGQVFWVPRRFRYGLLAAGMWGNYGDVPTAVIMSITAASPFAGTADTNLAVAYISVFLLYFSITLYMLGGYRVIALDFEGPEDEENTKARQIYPVPLELYQRFRKRHRTVTRGDSKETVIDEKAPSVAAHSQESIYKSGGEGDEVDAIAIAEASAEGELGMSIITVVSRSEGPMSSLAQQPTLSPPPPYTSSRGPRRFRRFAHFLGLIFTPQTIAISIAVPISVITPLKELFIAPAPGIQSPIPPGPDGLPPLSFILDTATFIGAASVPVGLMCLGSALAQLKIPRTEWRNLPFGAIISLAVGKMVLTPVLGVLICQGLAQVGVISKTDKVLRFVCMIFSCVPTSTTQVILTQIYSGTGSAEHLAPFLIPQYAIMLVSMTALMVYTLHILF